MEIFIGETRFKSKTAALDAIRTVLYKYPIGATLNEVDALFLTGVLARHRHAVQKIGCGVASFQVEQNASQKIGQSRGFWLTRIDGTRTDFSFPKCLTPPSAEAEAKAAFRLEIADQIAAFRKGLFQNGNIIICPLSGKRLPNSLDTHIDHDPPFEGIFQAFLASRAITPDAIQVEPSQDSDIETRLLDRTLAEDWSKWHAEHAGLRAVDRLANLRRR